MSTKIYNGVRIRDDRGPFDVLQDVRETLRHWFLRHNRQTLLDAAINLLDAPYGKQTSFRDALGEILHREVIADMEKKETDSLTKNAEIVLLRNRQRDETYAIYYGTDGFDEFLKLDSVAEAWPYWDNADAPDGMTEAAFRRRGARWREALDWSQATGSQGLTIQVLSEFEQHWHTVDDMRANLVHMSLPDGYARATWRARQRHLHDALKDVQRSQFVSTLMRTDRAWREMPEAERDALVAAEEDVYAFPPLTL